MNERFDSITDAEISKIWFDAQDAYDQIQQNYNPQLELIIAKSAYWSYKYSLNILKAPFPLAEDRIANSYQTVEYAKNVLKSRFKLAENKFNKLLLKDWAGNCLIQYTKHILKFNHE